MGAFHVDAANNSHLGYRLIDMIVGFCALMGKEKLAFSLDFLTILFRFNSHTIMSTHFNCTIQCFLAYSQSCVTITTIPF